MRSNDLLIKIANHPETVTFNEVIATITEHYHYTPSRLSNGVEGDQVVSEPGSNEGSCKIFAFAKLNKLSEIQTLHCFGDYYRQDVLQNPGGNDHGNIRTFMRHGWGGIEFDQAPLTEKTE